MPTYKVLVNITQIMTYTVKFDVNVLKITLTVLMKLVAAADNKNFKKYQKMLLLYRNNCTFKDISLNIDNTNFVH